MAPNVRELEFEHELDAAWIIALWHFIYGGDPLHDVAAAQTTELLVRGLVSHLSQGRNELSKDIVEKLGQLGIKVHMQSGEQRTDVTSTKQLHESRSRSQGKDRPIPCLSIINGHPVCWSPIFGPIKEITRGGL